MSPRIVEWRIFLMKDLIVKNVDVMGDSIKAAKDAAGNIWVGVRWVCNALELTEGQTLAYVINKKMPDCSEFGRIGVKPSIGGVIRIW